MWGRESKHKSQHELYIVRDLEGKLLYSNRISPFSELSSSLEFPDNIELTKLTAQIEGSLTVISTTTNLYQKSNSGRDYTLLENQPAPRLTDYFIQDVTFLLRLLKEGGAK